MHRQGNSTSKVIITDCKLSVVNSEMKAMITKTVSDSQSQDVMIGNLFNLSEIDKYLCSGTLTIQVNATLCFHCPTEKVYETQKLPLHLQL